MKTKTEPFKICGNCSSQYICSEAFTGKGRKKKYTCWTDKLGLTDAMFKVIATEDNHWITHTYGGIMSALTMRLSKKQFIFKNKQSYIPEEDENNKKTIRLNLPLPASSSLAPHKIYLTLED